MEEISFPFFQNFPIPLLPLLHCLPPLRAPLFTTFIAEHHRSPSLCSSISDHRSDSFLTFAPPSLSLSSLSLCYRRYRRTLETLHLPCPRPPSLPSSTSSVVQLPSPSSSPVPPLLASIAGTSVAMAISSDPRGSPLPNFAAELFSPIFSSSAPARSRSRCRSHCLHPSSQASSSSSSAVATFLPSLSLLRRRSHPPPASSSSSSSPPASSLPHSCHLSSPSKCHRRRRHSSPTDLRRRPSPLPSFTIVSISVFTT